jgi:hypothetical protein
VKIQTLVIPSEARNLGFVSATSALAHSMESHLKAGSLP